MAKDLKNILLSTIEENKIKEKTPDKLPLNPTAEGWSGQEVRRFLAKSLIDSEGSFLAEFKKKMIEIKAQFEDVFGDGDGDIQGQIDSIIQNIDEVELTASSLATTVLNNYNSLNNLKVNKTLTILGIDLQDDITLPEFKAALGDATLFANGLMSALDKQNLAQTMIDIQSLFSGKADKTVLTSTIQAVTDLQNNKVPKTTTIIGLDLQDDILIGEFRTALGNATQSVAGLLSAKDKTHLDSLVALLETSDGNNVVDTIGEILAIFQNYPEGADILTALSGKVNEVEGKGLSTNDFTDEYKNKVDTLEISKQDKLVAGDSITIDENNVIEVDLNEMSYFDYAGSIYGAKYSLLEDAWKHSLTVDTEEISADSTQEVQRGTAQYPNGETKGVIIPHGVTSIGAGAFFDWLSNNQPLVIPNSVTSIGGNAFGSWASNSHPLVIPDSVISIGNGAFNSWISNNQPLTIPQGVTNIGNGAFNNWASNSHPLVIPSSVASIGVMAFRNWSLVPYVEIQAITPPSLANADAFVGQNDAPIYVPDESVEAYKTANNWVDLADRIFPISDKEGISASDIIDDLTSTDTNKPLSANQGKVLNDTTAKLAVSNVFTQPQQVPNGTLPQHTTNKLQVETMFEMFKQQLRGYNLASPDLTDKEHLGDGIYRVSDLNGITVDYNIYNGEYEVNGTMINIGFTSDDIFKPTLLSGELTAKLIYISGEKSIIDSDITIRLQNQPNISPTFANLINGATNNYDNQDRARLWVAEISTFTNYKFKLQLEKGSTATPYTVPGQIPQYKIVGEE